MHRGLTQHACCFGWAEEQGFAFDRFMGATMPGPYNHFSICFPHAHSRRAWNGELMLHTTPSNRYKWDGKEISLFHTTNCPAFDLRVWTPNFDEEVCCRGLRGCYLKLGRRPLAFAPKQWGSCAMGGRGIGPLFSAACEANATCAMCRFSSSLKGPARLILCVDCTLFFFSATSPTRTTTRRP